MQVNQENVDLIKEMLEEGSIEDENDYFNMAYENIVIPENHIELKEHLTCELMKSGSSRDGRIAPTIENGCLWDQYLLVPVKQMLSMERWGHHRYGQNGISAPLDLSEIHLEKYQAIEKTTTVCMLTLRSG